MRWKRLKNGSYAMNENRPIGSGQFQKIEKKTNQRKQWKTDRNEAENKKIRKRSFSDESKISGYLKAFSAYMMKAKSAKIRPAAAIYFRSSHIYMKEK